MDEQQQDLNTQISKSIGWAFNYFSSENFKLSGADLDNAITFKGVLRSLLSSNLVLVPNDRLKELEALAKPKDVDKEEGKDE